MHQYHMLFKTEISTQQDIKKFKSEAVRAIFNNNFNRNGHKQQISNLCVKDAQKVNLSHFFWSPGTALVPHRQNM